MTSFAQNGLLLDVQHVTMRFGGITAVNDLSMRIPTGSITGLIGPNGAGKTTAFNVISGFYNPQEGDILFKGHSVKGFPPHRICRAGMARTFPTGRSGALKSPAPWRPARTSCSSTSPPPG